MSEALSILYVGELREGLNGVQRLRALKELGHNVIPVDTRRPRDCSRLLSLWSRINNKLFRMGFPSFRFPDLAGANAAILDHVRDTPVDLILLDKVVTVRAETLREVKKIRPRCLIAGCSGDDMTLRHHQSKDFLESVPLYDVYFTPRTFGVAELQEFGFRRVYFIPFGFDLHAHHPVPVSAEEKKLIGGEVGFIGYFEEERARSIQFLASQGIPVRIYGDGWKPQPADSNMRVEGRTVWNQDYAKTLCAFDIVLCFLRRFNRDRQTCRSYEIPACGAFMLAERTEEHLELFKEGVEAEFFSSDEELLSKVRYYLAHPEQRKRIAAAGRERCLRSGYSQHDRMRSMIEKVVQLR